MEENRDRSIRRKEVGSPSGSPRLQNSNHHTNNRPLSLPPQHRQQPTDRTTLPSIPPLSETVARDLATTLSRLELSMKDMITRFEQLQARMDARFDGLGSRLEFIEDQYRGSRASRKPEKPPTFNAYEVFVSNQPSL